MTYLVNAFSLNMLDSSKEFSVHTEVVDREKARDFMGIESPECAIGHQDLWGLVRKDLLLADDLTSDRKTVQLGHRDRVLVTQYRGPRLPEGATELPEDATIEYWLVTVLDKAEVAKDRDERIAGLNRRIQHLQSRLEDEDAVHVSRDALDVPYECGGFPGTVLDMVLQLKQEAEGAPARHTRR